MEFIIPTAKLKYLYFINISGETPAMCKRRSFYSDRGNLLLIQKNLNVITEDLMFLLK